MGNDVQYTSFRTVHTISIHVPAWGTTVFPVPLPPQIKLFQSTFPRGERPDFPYISQFQKNFNPRSRVGNDEFFRIFQSVRMISIHVPAWGTTTTKSGKTWEGRNFNPRSRVGNDSGQDRMETERSEFQSTFPRGERQHLYLN